MRHAKGNKKLGKPTDQRIALLRGLAIALFSHEKIKTTDLRAKQAKRLVEKIITFGKDGTLHARRMALKALPDSKIVDLVFKTIAPRYTDRPGGYTRVIKLNTRQGDGASISLLELVD